ncbi:hypothetical protein Q4E40_08055 [Pontibacter sp. BT731]|nr:hypothetical protein [Pontibacter sp. BT731]
MLEVDSGYITDRIPVSAGGQNKPREQRIRFMHRHRMAGGTAGMD